MTNAGHLGLVALGKGSGFFPNGVESQRSDYDLTCILMSFSGCGLRD